MSIVIAPANTGKDSSNRIVVIRIAQLNKDIFSIHMFLFFMIKIVEIKLIDEIIDEIPATWREKMRKSTDSLEWNSADDRGGYIVHPVPIEFFLNIAIIIKFKDAGSSQKLKLFVRGNAMSCVLIIKGIIQLPKPPIIRGITKKKIIMIAWDVTIEL